MQHDAKKYLYDIQQACELVAGFTRDKQLADYLNDPLLRSAVERQIEIIGEAASGMSKATPDVAMHIAHYKRMIAMRNRLIHGYATVDDAVVWDVVQYDLPELMKQTTDLLAKE
jgi:uncharacterized protein with HEPN domain